MRIDAHQHFWDVSLLPYPWMPEGRLRRNYLPEDLQPILERNRFDGSIVVQAATDDREAEWLLGLAEQNSFIAGVVAWVDLRDAQLGRRLDVLQRSSHFCGVRHPVHDEPDDRWLLRDDVIAGLRELASRDIPYDLLLRPVHLPLVVELSEKVPGLRMVIDHIAKPRIAEHLIDDWARDMEKAAQIDGLHVKLSGMITEAEAQWTAEDLRPYVQHVYRLFGEDRVIFGSDWPVCLLAGSWKQVLAAFTQALGPLPVSVREKLLGDNAARFYGRK
jgi:L-fuconolactonase